MAGVVIDKSYLRGVPAEDFRRLNGEHDFLVTEALLYELAKDSASARAKLFRKLQSNRGVILLPNMWSVIDHELKSERPSRKPSELAVPRDYSSANRLAEDGFLLTDEMQASLYKRQQLIRLNAECFLVAGASALSKMIPDTKLSSKDEVYRLAENLVNDKGFIASFYFALSDAENVKEALGYTPPAEIDSRWSTWVLFQLYVVFYLDVAFRHKESIKVGLPEKTKEKLAHDFLDLEYLFLGLIEGCFATREKKLISWWKLLGGKEGLLT